MLKPCTITRKCSPAMLVLATGFAATLFAPLPTCGQTYGLSDLPAEARPSDLSVFLEARVTGTLVYVCRPTDVIGRMAWYLRESEATLFDARKNQIGKSHFKYSGIPLVRVKATWEDTEGGTVVAGDRTAGRGTLLSNPDVEWQRYDVESRSGEGPITEAKAIFRIAPWRTIPYAERCDKSHAGTEVRAQINATDLFLK
jgi:hypothetical protein